MNIIGSIIIGLILGIVAKLLHPGKDPAGFLISILLGLADSMVAGWMGKMLWWYADGESAGFLFSVVGTARFASPPVPARIAPRQNTGLYPSSLRGVLRIQNLSGSAKIPSP